MIIHAKNIRPASDNRFMIFGQRNSGTNYIQKVIEENLHKQFSNLIIWKHWMGFADGNKDEVHSVLAVGIVRDPIDWLSSMKEAAPHAAHMSKQDWIGFLQNEWWSKRDDLDYDDEIIEDRDFDTKERYENILKMRSKKLSWLLAPDISCPYILIRYEDLKSDMQAVIIKICETFDIPIPSDFKHITQDVKRGQEYKPINHPRPPPEAMRIIREQLDWGLEAKVGYSF